MYSMNMPEECLFGIVITYVTLLVVFSLKSTKKLKVAQKEEKEEKVSAKRIVWNLIKMAICVVVIYYSAEGVVHSCSFFAKSIGVSDTIIGVTIVALGTSLPELVTSIVASSKGQNEIAIGNVVGSNIFNLLFVLGSAASISPIEGLLKMNFIDTVICFGVMLFCYMFVLFGKKFRRVDGAVMLVLYALFMVFAVLREIGVIVL